MIECVALVTNKLYIDKTILTINQIRSVGKYNGIILLLIGDDLKDCIANYNIDNNLIIKYFEDIDRSEYIEIYKRKPISDGREINKIFQWHKLYLFHPWIKENFDKCFYIDAGVKIFKDISKLMNQNCENKLIAHSDSYPTYEWKLSIQFDKIQFSELFNELSYIYNLQIDYFQSTIMLFDTNIISDSTFDDLIFLSKKWINSRTNEQAIMNIYFNCIKKVWSPSLIKDEDTYYYDFFERGNLKCNDYIMLKYPKTN